MQPLEGKTKVLAALFVLAAASLFVFSPALNAGFVNSWDDASYVTDNPLVRSLAPANLARIATAFLLGNYHPLTLAVLAVQYRLFGQDARGYHAVSVLFHAVNCLLVFWLIYLVWGNIPAAFLSALLFGLHPLRVESVAWISDQKDLLAAGLALLTACGYVHFLRKRRTGIYVLALLAFVLSLLAKASALLLPFFLLLTVFVLERRLGRKRIIETIPFFCASLVLGVASVFARGSYQSQLAEHVFSAGQKALIGLDRFIYYFLGRNFYLGSHPYLNTYYLARNGLPAVPTLIAAVILAVIVLFAIESLKFTRKIAWASGLFAIFVLPALLTVSLGYSADRFTYLPSVAVAFLGGEYFVWIYRSVHGRARIVKYTFAGISVAMLAVMAVVTRQSLASWRDSLSLTGYFVKVYPDDPTAYLNRGLAYQEERKTAPAIADFTSALVINPGYAEAYNRRALVYYERGDFERAIIDLSSALSIDPANAEFYYNRGNVYYDLRALGEAEADYTSAIGLDSTRPESFYNRGNIRARMGRAEAAVADYTRAIMLDPGHSRAYYNRAISYFLLKDYPGSYRDLKMASALGFKVDPALIDTVERRLDLEKK